MRTVRKIVEYDVVSEETLVRMIECVDAAIEKGWEPIGGVGTTPDESDYYFYQAIVRYGEVEE